MTSGHLADGFLALFKNSLSPEEPIHEARVLLHLPAFPRTKQACVLEVILGRPGSVLLGSYKHSLDSFVSCSSMECHRGARHCSDAKDPGVEKEHMSCALKRLPVLMGVRLGSQIIQNK